MSDTRPAPKAAMGDAEPELRRSLAPVDAEPKLPVPVDVLEAEVLHSSDAVGRRRKGDRRHDRLSPR
jgi:hypothetical protein